MWSHVCNTTIYVTFFSVLCKYGGEGGHVWVVAQTCFIESRHMFLKHILNAVGYNYVFSSPELKAQVSFSDHLSSVCPSVCLSVCLSVCKLFTFSTSSPEPLGQFQPNLAQSILGWRRFKFLEMNGPAIFQREIIHWLN